MWVAVLDYSAPNVVVIETEFYDDEDIQDLLIKKGFSLSNIEYMTMDNLNIKVESL